MKLARRLILGTPEALDGPGLARALRRGDDAWRARSVRALASREEPQAAAAIRGVLDDPTPGVRRAAAAGLGWRGEPGDAGALRERLATEPTTSVRLALAAALVRCGGSAREGADALSAGAGLIRTARGWRSPEASVGFDEGAVHRELVQTLDPSLAGETLPDWSDLRPAPREAVRARLLKLMKQDPHSARGRQAIEELALQGHPDDLQRLRDLRAEAGRRTINVLIIALGKLGDPRGLPDLIQDLDRMDVDPGRGFAYRRLVALAIGRMGMTSEAPRLLRALEVEARNYEGKPGAGLGIQFPVRSNLLWGLGELQAARAVKELLPYLANMHGSALGGFHLPAMGALLKLGRRASPELERVAARGEEGAGINAVGVLEATGDDDALGRVAAGVGLVAEAARAALDGSDRPPRSLRAARAAQSAS